MSEKDLNIKYICEKTLLDEQDELVPIILEMIKDSYKVGLTQAKFDNDMGLIEENQQKEFVKYLEKCIKKLEKPSMNKLQNTINLGISDVTKEILSKYKEIIGGENEK